MTKKTYVIRSSASFRMPDGSVKTGGEEIDLDSDVAATHADKVDLKAETVAETDLPSLVMPSATS